MKVEGVEAGGERGSGLAEAVRALDAECRDCSPVSPLECISGCNVWKMKNEFRHLRVTMGNPNFVRDLFNVLKNGTRLLILRAIVKRSFSVDKLQEELKKFGHSHSRDTINQEYLRPLLEVGLAVEAQEKYYATAFGGRLNDLIGDFSEFVTVLPAHSECYEETLLNALLCEPKTFEEIEALLSSSVASRILGRLRANRLVQAPKEKDYVFFFRSKRDPNVETLSLTERRVYDDISENGISAGKLAKKVGISLRRTYKYLRGLKGRKLVFTRKTPKVYGLTEKGEKLALLLGELQNLVEETWASSEQVVNGDKS